MPDQDPPRFDQADHFDLTCKPGVLAVQAYILDRWDHAIDSGCVTSRPNDGGGISEHNEGRAGDTGIRPLEHPHGIEIAAWLYHHRAALGCQTIIYNGSIWSADRAEAGWRPYTANRHVDHIHWELNWDGARKRTSWFTNQGADPPVTPQEIQQIAAAVDVKLNRVIGTFQDNMKEVFIPSIVRGVVKSIKPLLTEDAARDLDANAIADAVVAELGAALTD